MEITTKPQFKAIVSALRRELKALDRPTSSLSFNDVAEVLSKGFHFKGVNQFATTLTDSEKEEQPLQHNRVLRRDSSESSELQRDRFMAVCRQFVKDCDRTFIDWISDFLGYGDSSERIDENDLATAWDWSQAEDSVFPKWLLDALEGASQYPLVNDKGQFDFVPFGQQGRPVSSYFESLHGRLDLVPTLSLASFASRKKSADSSCNLEPDFDGLSVDDDFGPGEPKRGKDGFNLWEDRLNGEVSEAHVVLIPHRFEGDIYDNMEIVRQPLVDEFVKYYRAHSIDNPTDFSEAEDLLGFMLTCREQESVGIALRR